MSEETDIFSIAASKTKYSKYAFSLDRLFKNNSLNCLKEKLRHPVYFKPKEEKIDDGFKQIRTMKLEKGKEHYGARYSLNKAQKNHNYNNEDKLKLQEINNGVKTNDKKELTDEQTDKANKELSFKEFIEQQRFIK